MVIGLIDELHRTRVCHLGKSLEKVTIPVSALVDEGACDRIAHSKLVPVFIDQLQDQSVGGPVALGRNFAKCLFVDVRIEISINAHAIIWPEPPEPVRLMNLEIEADRAQKATPSSVHNLKGSRKC